MEIVRSYECMNACILNHMRYNGIKITGSDIFFTGEGFFIRYKNGSLIGIKSEGYDSNFRFLCKYGIDFEFVRVQPSKDTLLKCLREPYTITIRMVTDFLNYDRVFAQTSGASHFINIMAYDKDKKKFLIVDGDVPCMETGCFYGWVEEVDILKGWQLMQGELLRMRLSSDISETLCEQVKEEADEQVRYAIQKYLSGRKNVFSGWTTGQQAICCMIEQLEKYVGKNVFRELVLEANFRLRVDGYLGAKYFLLEKIKEQKKMVLFKEYEKLVTDWSRWCMLLVKSGLASKKIDFFFVKEKMKVLNERERLILERILG